MPEWLSEFFEHFHWLRPLWLLIIPTVILFIAGLWRLQSQTSGWQQVIAPELLVHLISGESQRQSRVPLIGLGIVFILASLAMAGPSWEKIPQPIHKSEQALVILLDLSPSMLAQDLKPSRLVRARLKLIDLLKQRQEGLTALVAFAGESHVITPLTDDTETIISLVPSMSPGIMPLSGSNPEMAVEQALALLQEAGIKRGQLLLVTDGITSDAIDTMEQLLSNQHSLSILGVGSESGAPIPISTGGFAKDKSGGMVLAKLNSGQLQQFSRRQGGRYRTLVATNSDIDSLAQKPQMLDDATREVSREFDLWLDRGAWLTLLVLPLLLAGFRRGWLLSVALVILPLPQPAHAFDWQDLWQTADQQGQTLLQQGDPSAAAQKFDDPQWAGSAHYQANEYQEAIDNFALQDDANGHYNRANALAKNNQLDEALNAYQRALEKNPEFDDAKHNQKLVEELLKQQEQQQDQSGENGDSQESQGDQQQDNQQTPGDQQNNQQGQSQENAQDQNSQQQKSEQQGDSESQKNDPSNAQQKNKKPEDQSPTSQEQNEQNEASNESEKPSSQELTETNQSSSAEDKEQQQALEQWLRKVPDDPSGLMREKFKYQYNQRRLQYQQGTWEPPQNNALERW